MDPNEKVPGSPANGTTAGPVTEGPGEMKDKIVTSGPSLVQDGKLSLSPAREFPGIQGTPGPYPVVGDQPSNVKGGPQ